MGKKCSINNDDDAQKVMISGQRDKMTSTRKLSPLEFQQLQDFTACKCFLLISKCSHLISLRFLSSCLPILLAQLKVLLFLAPTRSPRRGDLVRACVRACVRVSVRACVCDIIQNNSENEF